MAILGVQSNGLAPSSAQVGDIISTGGGNYLVSSPNAPGSTYNPDSGLWSQKLDDMVDMSMLAYQDAITEKNNALNLQNAREQMNFQSEANAKAMEFSAREAEKNRQFQAEMSNTSYQRAVKDLLAAGLNPVLAAMNSGASTPSGSAASGVTSSGSQAKVDESGLAFLGSMISSMINADTQRYMSDNSVLATKLASENALAGTMFSADLANQASRYASDRSSAAMMASASISAQAQMAMVQKQIENAIYMAQNYPSGPWSWLSSISNGLLNGNGFDLSSFLGNVSGIFSGLFGNHDSKSDYSSFWSSVVGEPTEWSWRKGSHGSGRK